MTWQILALRYGETTNRKRRDSFILATEPDAPHPMDFAFWVLRRGAEVIVVDTGMDKAEGKRRMRPVRREPVEMLESLGIAPDAVTTLVMTHLHFDHAGALAAFPNATLHIQAAELAWATGYSMTNPTLAMPYSAAHVAEAVGAVHAGRTVVHDGAADIAPGVTGHLIGGHSRGLMALTVDTARGPLILASDVAHYYESVTHRPVFQIVADPEAMVRGYDWLWRMAGGDLARILPAHDPALREIYPALSTDPDILDLSAPPGPTLDGLT